MVLRMRRLIPSSLTVDHDTLQFGTTREDVHSKI